MHRQTRRKKNGFFSISIVKHLSQPFHFPLRSLFSRLIISASACTCILKIVNSQLAHISINTLNLPEKKTRKEKTDKHPHDYTLICTRISKKGYEMRMRNNILQCFVPLNRISVFIFVFPVKEIPSKKWCCGKFTVGKFFHQTEDTGFLGESSGICF